jgi:hypothetical protein
MNYSSNSYTRGQNITSDQNSYDLIYKDVIVNYNNTDKHYFDVDYPVNLNFNYERIYKAELVSGNVHFYNDASLNVYSIPDSVKNSTFLLSIKELNGISLELAITPDRYHTQYRNREIFCQIPDNYTPLGGGKTEVNPSNCISTYINNSPYNAIQYYNPPLSNVNKMTISFYDLLGNNLLYPGAPVTTADATINGVIDSFYLTIRMYYFQKRNNTTAFSVPLFNYAATGTLDSLYAAPANIFKN